MKKKTSKATPYIFLSPWFIGFLLFTGGPILLTFILSLTKWDLLGTPEFVGLANYKTIFSAEGEAFRNTLKVTLKFTVINSGFSVFVSLLLALLLNMKIKHMGIFQFLYFIPSVIPFVVMASILKLMFSSEMGVINYFLNILGINSVNWFGNNKLIWVVVGIASIFTFSTGQMMLIFNSSIKEVPEELYEACSLDGGGFWQQFINVTLPSISPMLFFNIVVATVNSFNGAFTLLYPLTGGGPGDATKVLSLLIYDKAFRAFDMGTASTLAVILFVIVASIAFLQFRLSENKITY